MEVMEYKDKRADEMQLRLSSLIQNGEDEVVEFKETGNDYDQYTIGKYFSAISNEANLRGLQYGWLIFGIRDKDKCIVARIIELMADFKN